MGMFHINRNRQNLGQFDEQDVADGLQSGKFSPDDLAWQEPMTEWKPLREIANLPAPSVQAIMPPSELAGAASRPLADTEPSLLPSRAAGMLDIGKCIEAGWNCFTVNWSNLVLGTVIIFALSLMIQIPVQICDSVAEMFKKHGQQETWILFAMGAVFFFFNALAMAVSSLINGGYFYFLLMSLRKAPNISDLFAGFKESTWPQLMLGLVTTFFLVLLGFVCFILPGVYLLVAFYYAPILIIDRKMGFWDAMQLSRKTVHAQWFQVFGLGILSILASILGVFLCCVGMFGTLPIGSLWIVEGYRQLFGDSPEAR